MNDGTALDVDYRIRSGDGDWISVHEIVNGQAGTASFNGSAPRLHPRRDRPPQRRAGTGSSTARSSIASPPPSSSPSRTTIAARSFASGPRTRLRPGCSVPLPPASSAARSPTCSAPLDESLVARARSVAAGAEGFVLERVEGLGIDRQKTFSLQVFSLPGSRRRLRHRRRHRGRDGRGRAAPAGAPRRPHRASRTAPCSATGSSTRSPTPSAARRTWRSSSSTSNHFKDVNDALGHQYGDRLLIEFAKRLQALLRECDTIARLGGDEFALLLTHATNEGASRVVTKVTERDAGAVRHRRRHRPDHRQPRRRALPRPRRGRRPADPARRRRDVQRQAGRRRLVRLHAGAGQVVGRAAHPPVRAPPRAR